MTLREKIGQLIFSGFPSTEPGSDFVELCEDYKLGNVILFSRNITAAGQTRKLCTDLQSLIKKNSGHPAFISVDQEGGMVTRLSSDCTNFPGAMAVAATNNADNAFCVGHITGLELKSLGFNMDLAPVMDVNSNPLNPVIGVRSYGENPEEVADYGINMMKGLVSSGILSVLKHFPGHGDTLTDSHLSLPRISSSLEDIEKMHLLPFKRAIDAGAEAVMISHILFSELDKENKPASMSKAVITGLLKKKLNFKGLVMTDCLEMNAVRDNFGTARGALEALKAGADMLFISHSAELVKEAVQLIEAAVDSGELSIDRLNNAVDKVLDFKRKYLLEIKDTDLSIPGCRIHMEEAERISRESITLVRDTRRQLPLVGDDILFIGCKPAVVTKVMNNPAEDFNFPEYMAAINGGESLVIDLNPLPQDMDRVLETSKKKKAVVFGTYNANIYKGQLEMLKRLCDEHENVIAVALRNPYDLGMLDENTAALACYEYTHLALNSVSKVLRGEYTATGRLPVTL